MASAQIMYLPLSFAAHIRPVFVSATVPLPLSMKRPFLAVSLRPAVGAEGTGARGGVVFRTGVFVILAACTFVFFGSFFTAFTAGLLTGGRVSAVCLCLSPSSLSTVRTLKATFTRTPLSASLRKAIRRKAAFCALSSPYFRTFSGCWPSCWRRAS